MSSTTQAYIKSFGTAILGIVALLFALKCITSGLMVINKNRLAKISAKGRARNKKLWSITADQMKQFKISKSVIDIIRTESDFESRVAELKRYKKHKLEKLIKRTTGLEGKQLQHQTEQVYEFLRWYKPKKLAELSLRDRVVNSWYGDVVSGFLFVVFISQSSSVMNAITIAGVSSGTMSEHKAATYGTGGEIGTTLTAHLAAFGMALKKLPFKYFAWLVPIGYVAYWVMSFFKKRREKKEATVGKPVQRRFKTKSKLCAHLNWYKDPNNIKGLCKAIGGFGLIFLALQIIGDAFKTPEVKDLLTKIFAGFDNPWALMVTAVIATAIISSSSMVTSITVTMTLTNIITIEQALAIVSGANIGTCLTTNLAAIGQTKAAKRAAMMTLHLNLVPALVFTTILTFSAGQQLILSGLEILSVDPARQAAWFHTFFNISALLMFPFLGWMLAMQKKLNPDDGQGVFDRWKDNARGWFAKRSAPDNHPMPGVELRLAQPEELNEIKKGYINLVKYLRRHKIAIWYGGYPMNMLEDEIARDELYVLARGGTLVGAVALSRAFLHDPHFTWQTKGPALYITHFGIFPEFLKKKISYKFLELIEDLAREKKYKSLRLMIDHGHTAAIRMNENFGLKYTGGDYSPPLYPDRIKRGYEKDVTAIKAGTETPATKTKTATKVAETCHKLDKDVPSGV